MSQIDHYCARCGAHFSDPHAPYCPADGNAIDMLLDACHGWIIPQLAAAHRAAILAAIDHPSRRTWRDACRLSVQPGVTLGAAVLATSTDPHRNREPGRWHPTAREILDGLVAVTKVNPW